MATANRGVALVTGGSRGIGFGIAEELAEMGYGLFLVAKDVKRLKRAAEVLERRHGITVRYAACDLSSTRSIDSLYRTVASKVKTLDVLVDNAGVYISGGTASASMGKFDRIFSVNMRGMFYLTKRMLPFIMRGKTKRIILTSSIWAWDSYPTDGREDGTIYSISKWAVRGWARSLRAELKKHRIGVTVIYPGETLTDEWRGSGIPAERFMKPGDLGKIVRAVLSTGPGTVIEEVTVRPMDWKYPKHE